MPTTYSYSQQSEAPHGKIKSLQGLRFLFITLIVASHLFPRFDFGGEGGVAFFFVLSGFVLSWSQGLKVAAGQFCPIAFLRHQLCKVYPLMLLMVVVMWFADVHAGHGWLWKELLANVFLLKSWLLSDKYLFSILGTSWFVGDIFFLYLCFKPLYLFTSRQSKFVGGATWALVLAVYLPFLVGLPAGDFNRVLYSFPPFRLIDFWLGIALYRFYVSARGQRLMSFLFHWSPLRLDILMLLWSLCFLLSYLAYQYVLPVNVRGAMLFWPFVVVVVFLCVILEQSGRSTLSVRLLASKPMLFLGDMSMEIFLTHQPVLYVVNMVALHLGIYVTHPLAVQLVCVPCILLVAWLSQRYFSRPVYRWLSKW